MRNERGYYTNYTYDPMNRVLTIKDPLGKTITYGYDKAGNRVTVSNDKPSTITYSYDKLNRVDTVKDPEGTLISKKIYDANGNVLKEIDAKGYLSAGDDSLRYGTIFTYDLANRLVIALDPEVASKGRTFSTKYEYNQYSQKTKQTDALNNSMQYEYDNAGRLAKVIDAMQIPASTQFSYDKRGNKLSTVDGRGKITSFTYGSFGIRRSFTDADNKTSTYKYELAFNTAKVTDKNGNDILYAYDARNLLLSKSVTQTGDNINYSYNEAGSRIGMTDVTGNYTYLYYENDWLYSISKNGVTQVSYTYDNVGNVETVTDKKGFTTTYTYDSSNRMKAVNSLNESTIKEK